MNKLGAETSPYLLQHADNPVEWYPWGDEALARARAENKPILLSIGYSACHWCHVMAHESFENDATAALMNQHFINIKVDREERPDLDKIYQTAHHLLTRNRGGWPLTMFLTADDHVPFFGGTYFPPAARHGLPGFNDLLVRVAAAYREHAAQIQEYKTQMLAALAEAGGGGGTGDLDAGVVTGACAEFAAAFDAEHGGFGGAPKFPHPSGLELLLTEHVRTARAADSANLLQMATQTLTGMAAGGIYDHLGGGFCRYAVDASWTIPHFEKMLYDNGPLLAVYAQAWRLEARPLFAQVAEETADWMLREMRAPAGGFYSSLDADSEGEEGRFYVWTRAEVQAVLGADHDVFAARYGLDGPANFEGRWHLRLRPGAGPDVDAAAPAIAAARRALYARRQQRVHPGLDDKILTSWNALAIKGLAVAGSVLQREDYIDAAAGAVDYLRTVHWREGRLLATSKDGVAHLNAYLDDYAFLLDALLELLSARWRALDLEFASALATVIIEQFEDSEGGGFYFTSRDHESLIQRTKSYADDALPAGNAIAARALLRLAHLVGESRYVVAAERALEAAMADATRWPAGHAMTMIALMDSLEPAAFVVLRGTDPAATRTWEDAARAGVGMRGSSFTIAADVSGLPGLLGERRPHPGAAVTAYVCRGHHCSAPALTLPALRAALSA